MKKQLLLKPLLTLALVMICGNVWGIDYSFTPNVTTSGNSSGSYVTTAYSFTYNNISWSFNQWNPTSLQIKTNQDSSGNEFNFKNTSAFPGKITKVVITFSALTVSDASKLCFVGGSSTISALSGGVAGTWDSTNKTLTWTPASTEEFTYFAFYQNGKAASGTNKLATENAIVVTYDVGTKPLISAGNVTIKADATSGEIAFSVTNPVEGKSLSATSEDSWISNIAVSGNKVTFDAKANAAHAERTATITLKYEGANDKNVTVTQKKSSVFSNLEELVAAGEPTEDGEEVTVSFSDVAITEIITNGVYLGVNDSNNNPIEIYCKNVPTEWIEGGTVSATALTCPWKKYNSTWELCPTDWTDITYTAPVTYGININSSENGSVSVDATECAAGVTVALTITPNTHYVLSTLSVTKSTGGIVPLTDDKTFIMPACSVTVSATFKELDKFNVKYYSKNEYLSDETVYDGETIADAPTPTAPAGWSFCGWTEDADYSIGNTTPSIFNGVVTNSTKLYAVFSNEGDTPVWQIVTDKINVGDQIIIAAKDFDYAISTTQNPNNRGQAAVTKSEDEGKASLGENVQVINVEAGRIAETYAFNVSTGFLYAASSSNNYLKTETTLSNNSSWTVSITDGVATIKAQGTYTRNLLQYNSSSTLFSCYSSGQKNVCIYRKQMTYSLLSFDVTISSAKYATLCLPFNFTVPEGVTAYTAEVNDEQNFVNISAIAEDAVIPAGEGIIISGDAGTYTFIGSAETPSTLGDNDLIGVTEDTELTSGYILALDDDGTTIKFFQIDPDDNELGAYKAYLNYTGSANALGIRANDATGIRTIEAQTVNQYFDLMGRKVQNPERGIYILNGKKVYVK